MAHHNALCRPLVLWFWVVFGLVGGPARVIMPAAATAATATSGWTYSFGGSFNAWQARRGMTCAGPDGQAMWQLPVAGLTPGGVYDFKVAVNGSWSLSYGSAGGNAHFSAGPSGTAVLTFQPSSLAVGSTDAAGAPCSFRGTATFAGSFDGWQFAAAHRCPDDDSALWQLPLTSLSAAQLVEFKVAINSSWTSNWGANSTFDGSNVGGTADGSGKLTLLYRQDTHRVWSVPGPPKCLRTGTPYFRGTWNNWAPQVGQVCSHPKASSAWYTDLSGLTPQATYKAKVTIGTGWELNYGAGGEVNGPDFVFSADGTGRAVLEFASGTHEITREYWVACNLGALGSIPHFVFSVFSLICYLGLLGMSALQTHRHFHSPPKATVRQRCLSMVLVMAFSVVRAVMSLLHVVRAYVDAPNWAKHLLFVLPLCFVCTSYTMVIYFWYRIASSVRGSIPVWVRNLFLAVNAVVYTGMIASIVAREVLEESPDAFHLVGVTNVTLAGLLGGGLVVFSVFGWRVYRTVAPKKPLSNRAHSGSTSGGKGSRKAACKVSTLALCCTLSFGLMAAILAYEGWYLIVTGSFVASDGEYTTPVFVECVIFITTAAPPGVLVLVLWRGASLVPEVCVRGRCGCRQNPSPSTSVHGRTTSGRGAGSASASGKGGASAAAGSGKGAAPGGGAGVELRPTADTATVTLNPVSGASRL